jgi:hypothetical protein
MLNAVLNAIPIFYLSFLKMPIKVRKKVVRIQREFLWGGVKGGKKINWVKWAVVCRERRNGGLGVRDVSLVNSSLLAKWRWRLLLPERALWKEVLVAKYGGNILRDVVLSRSRLPSKVSTWWKDIMSLEKLVPGKNWLVESFHRKVGDGSATSFWWTKWVGDIPLALPFPRLYSLSNHKENMIREFVEEEGESRGWAFLWRRNLFHWEEERVEALVELLETVTLTEEEDVWRWLPDEKGEFSVNSAYKLLVRDLGENGAVEDDLVTILGQIWESPAPSKVVAFSWQLLYDRIPTRSNLCIRGIPLSDVPWECLGCIGKVESSNHLFLHCSSAMLVWSEIFKWIGVVIVIPPSISSLFEFIKGSTLNVKIRKRFLLIWHATLWSIWKARNNALFANGLFNPRLIIEDIKVMSWKWVLSRLKVTQCLFYEWTLDPGECLLR